MKINDATDSRFGLIVAWIVVPALEYRFSVVDVRKDGNIASAFEAVAHPSATVVMVNGGYFGQKDAVHLAPMGLVVSAGKRISKIWPWTSGGVLVASSEKSPAQIIPINAFHSSAPFEAIQSKPLLVENASSGIRSDDHQFANRTAIAICRDGSLVFVGAFADGGAISLYEFAALLTSGKLSKSNVDVALNMDGGPGAHLYVPALGQHFGSDASTYVPNVITIETKEEL